MSDKLSDSDEGSWTILDKNESGDESSSSAEFVKVSDAAKSVTYHNKGGRSYDNSNLATLDYTDDELCAAESDMSCCVDDKTDVTQLVDGDTDHAPSNSCHDDDPSNDLNAPESDLCANDYRIADVQLDGQAIGDEEMIEERVCEEDGDKHHGNGGIDDEIPPSAGDQLNGNKSAIEGAACAEGNDLDIIGGASLPDTMFASLGENRQDSVDSDDSDRFSADFLGRSGLELRRQASSSDSDSDFVRIDPHHALDSMQRSGASSIGPQFHFLRRGRDDDEDSLVPGDVDDRCESDISLGDDSDDLPAINNAADLPIHNIPVIRNYQQKPNNNLNFILSVLAACVLCIAIGLGIGHAIGSAREATLQLEIRQGQQERLRVLQDDLLMCLQKQDEIDTTISKLTEIERLLKDADYWREEYEELLRVKLKNEENWKHEKETLSNDLKTSRHELRASTPRGYTMAFPYYPYLSEKRQLLYLVKSKERDILNLRLKLDMQTAITNEHIALETELKHNVDLGEDTKHHLQTEVSVLKVEKENLEEKLLEEHEDDVALQSTIDSLKTENIDLKSKLSQEEKEAHKLEEKVAILEAKLSREVLEDANMETEVSSLKHENVDLKSKLTQEEQEAHKLEEKVAILEAELSREVLDDADMETEVSSLKNENVDLKSKLTQEEQEALKLEEKVAILEAELTREVLDDVSMETEVSTLRSEILKLRGTIEDLMVGGSNKTSALNTVSKEVTSDQDQGHCTQEGYDDLDKGQHGVLDVDHYKEEMQIATHVKDEVESSTILQLKEELQSSEATILDLTTTLHENNNVHETKLTKFSNLNAAMNSRARKYRKSASDNSMLNEQLRMQLLKCQNSSANSSQPSLSACMALMFQCESCDENLRNLGDLLQLQLMHLANVSFNSEFMEYLRRKQTDFASSPHFQEFTKHFQSAYADAQKVFKSSWKKFEKATNSKEFKRSTDTAKETVNSYWKTIQDSDAYGNVVKATNEASKVLKDVSQKVSDRVHVAYKGMKTYSSPVIEGFLNSTRDAVLSLEMPKDTWKKIKKASKKFTDTKDSTVSDIYRKLKDNVAQGWKHVKEKCDKYTNGRHENNHSNKHGRQSNKHDTDDDDDDDDEDDDDDDGSNGSSSQRHKMDKKFKDRFRKYVTYFHALDKKQFSKMDKKDKKNIFKKIEDFEEDYGQSVDRLGKRLWFSCQMNWWKQASKGGKIQLDESCSGELMNWQRSLMDEPEHKQNNAVNDRKTKSDSEVKGHGNWAKGKKVTEKNETGSVLGGKDSDGRWYFHGSDSHDSQNHQPAWYFHRFEDRESRRHDSKWYFRGHRHGMNGNKGKHHGSNWMQRRSRDREYHHQRANWDTNRSRQRNHNRRHSNKW